MLGLITNVPEDGNPAVLKTVIVVSELVKLASNLVVGGFVIDSYLAGKLPERIYASLLTLLLGILWT